MSLLYLKIAGDISRATLLGGGEAPRQWEVSPIEFNQLIAEFDPSSLPLTALGVPIIPTNLSSAEAESSLGGIRQVSEGSGLNEDRRHDASAADEQVSSGDLGAPAIGEPAA